MTLGRASGLAVAGLMVLVGAVWFGQGNGWIGGSSMTDESFWAYAGAVTAGLGVALAVSIIQRARQQRLSGGDLDDRYGRRR